MILNAQGRKTLAVLCVYVAALTTGCSKTTEIEFVVPNDFMGVVEVVPNQSDGHQLVRKGRTVTFHVPDSGVLNLAGRDPFNEWHVIKARYKDGRTITHYGGELDYELLATASDSDLTPCIVELGSISGGRDGSSYVALYIGPPRECWEALSAHSWKLEAGKRIEVTED